MSEPQQKRIDIASGKLTAGGKTGYIQYKLSTTRYVEYLKKIPLLTYGVTFRELYGTMSDIYMATSSGNDMIFAIQTAREKSLNQLNAIKRFDENEIPDVIDFCALFINFENEDISKYDHASHEAKKILLLEEGYDVSDFFQLQVNLIDGFSPAFRKIQSLENQESQVDIRLTNNTQQT